jgi:hypothetical protein
VAIRATWLLVERFEDRSDGIFYLRKYFLERDWIFEGRIGNSIEVATITGILRIAGPLFPSLDVGNPQSSVSLSGMGKSGKPTLGSEAVCSRFRSSGRGSQSKASRLPAHKPTEIAG